MLEHMQYIYRAWLQVRERRCVEWGAGVQVIDRWMMYFVYATEIHSQVLLCLYPSTLAALHLTYTVDYKIRQFFLSTFFIYLSFLLLLLQTNLGINGLSSSCKLCFPPFTFLFIKHTKWKPLTLSSQLCVCFSHWAPLPPLPWCSVGYSTLINIECVTCPNITKCDVDHQQLTCLVWNRFMNIFRYIFRG